MATPKVERLVNLTVALLEARRPLTFADIRRRTRHYTQSDDESARRMFERDKDELRRLGVPIETRSLDAFDIDVGYTIDRRAYELPDVDLTPDEVAALAVALQVTGDEGARLGLTKLAARAPDPPGGPSAPVLATVDLGADAVDELAEAIVARRRVTFTYARPGGAAAERHLDPYAVAQRRGAWYLVGHDHARGAIRAFRLDRVIGEVRTVGDPGAYEIPSDLDIASALTGPAEEGTDVVVAVAPRATFEVELRGASPKGEHELVDGQRWPVYVLRQVSPWRAVSWLLGLGADVVVLDPPAVRDAVTTRLARFVEDVG